MTSLLSVVVVVSIMTIRQSDRRAIMNDQVVVLLRVVDVIMIIIERDGV